jgi:long-chain acyl-CoA synthetase
MDQNRQLLNKQLPAFEQVAKIIIQREEFEKTPKKSIKRFLYESAN